MNQHSKTTSDMTVSKSVDIEQQPPGQALPPHPDEAQSKATGIDSGADQPSTDQPGADQPSANPSGTAQADTSGAGKPDASDASSSSAAESDGGSTLRQVPIPPASEPLQYRAIGLIRGVYNPSEEQFTRGSIMTEDQTPIDAVLLGRVMSLVKKHVDLAQPHLWVVYPRTRPNNSDLHAQIVGVWEPENLNQDDFEASDDLGEDLESDLAGDLDNELGDGGTADDASDGASLDSAPDSAPEDAATDAAHDAADHPADHAASGDIEVEPEESATSVADSSKSADAPNAESAGSDASAKASPGAEAGSGAEAIATPTPPKKSAGEAASSNSGAAGIDNLQDGYFSIRGEVVRQGRGGQDLTIKICQAPRKGDKRGRAFKLLLRGTVDRRAVGSFWDMHVQRQGNDLVIQEAIFIKDMPPTKRRGRGGPPHRSRSGPPRRRQDRPAPAVQRQGSTAPSRPVPKPIKRQSRSSTPTE